MSPEAGREIRLGGGSRERHQNLETYPPTRPKIKRHAHFSQLTLAPVSWYHLSVKTVPRILPNEPRSDG